MRGFAPTTIRSGLALQAVHQRSHAAPRGLAQAPRRTDARRERDADGERRGERELRPNEKKKHDELDADLRSARALKLQIDDDAARIAAARRELFARETFASSSSVLSPLLWSSLRARGAQRRARDRRAFQRLVVRRVAARMTTWQIAIMLGAAAFAIALFAPAALGRQARHLARSHGGGAEPVCGARLPRRWTILVLAVLPLLVLGAVVLLMDASTFPILACEAASTRCSTGCG